MKNPRSAPVLLFLALAAAASTASALDTATRLVGPVCAWDAHSLAGYAASRIHVKFLEGADVLLVGGAFQDGHGRPLTAVNAALSRTGAVVAGPTFQVDRATARAWKSTGEQRSGRVGPDLSLWFEVDVTGGAVALAQALNGLNACPQVEIAHPAPLISEAVVQGTAPARTSGSTSLEHAPLAASLADAPRTTPDFTGMQEYLGPPPTGLNASAAWQTTGGTGTGMKVIDVELAWTLNHEDFPYSHLFYVGGSTQNPSYEPHGTSVLGEILGHPNGFGVNGFAPDVQYGVVSIPIGSWPNVPQYFQEAVDHLAAGDVWLIELQMQGGGSVVPMEFLQVNYDVIWTSVWSRGVVCVEAGANGSLDLDDAQFNGLFDRNLRDSGAIMVAAGTPYGRDAEYFTNYGTRMDAHSWGSEITTTGYGDLYDGGTVQTRYTSAFGGTSGASPMITGSALCLQGVALASFGTPLAPHVLRSIITATGIPSPDHARYIGPRPDLGAAVAAVLVWTSVPVANDLPPGIEIAPNPFRSGTVIRLAQDTRFAPGTSNPGRLRIVDAMGRTVRVFGAGEERIVWDGADGLGRQVGSGAYFLRFESLGSTQSARVLRVR